MFKKLTFVLKSVAVSILLIPAFTGNVNAQGKAGWQAAVGEITGEPNLPQTGIEEVVAVCLADCGAGDTVTLTIGGDNFLDSADLAIDPTLTLGGDPIGATDIGMSNCRLVRGAGSSRAIQTIFENGMQGCV